MIDKKEIKKAKGHPNKRKMAEKIQTQVEIKKDKTSEETHARSGSVWKVPKQPGLECKIARTRRKRNDKGG
jgi:hypothetical protein